MAGGLAGKIALITGASSGIGSATAKYFARKSAQLVLVGRDEARLSAVSKECHALSTENCLGTALEPLCVPADLCKSEDIKKVVSVFLSHHKDGLDILVNNAGIIELGGIENTSMEQLDRVMNINLRSLFDLTQQFVPAIIAVKGNIVNVSSVNGIRAFAGVQAYNISKAALDQFTRCTALELADRGVRVNSVNPGVIVTELQKRGGLSEEQYAQFLARCSTTHALGRPGQPEEVASAIAFLADNTLASFITGVLLPARGRWQACHVSAMSGQYLSVLM